MKQKLEVSNLSTDGYEFSGVVELGTLTAPVRGTFVVEWDNQYPIVTVQEASISGLASYNLLDFVDLAAKIKSTDTGAWYDDRMDQMLSEATKEAV